MCFCVLRICCALISNSSLFVVRCTPHGASTPSSRGVEGVVFRVEGEDHARFCLQGRGCGARHWPHDMPRIPTSSVQAWRLGRPAPSLTRLPPRSGERPSGSSCRSGRAEAESFRRHRDYGIQILGFQDQSIKGCSKSELSSWADEVPPHHSFLCWLSIS